MHKIRTLSLSGGAGKERERVSGVQLKIASQGRVAEGRCSPGSHVSYTLALIIMPIWVSFRNLDLWRRTGVPRTWLLAASTWRRRLDSILPTSKPRRRRRHDIHPPHLRHLLLFILNRKPLEQHFTMYDSLFRSTELISWWSLSNWTWIDVFNLRHVLSMLMTGALEKVECST